MRAGHNPELLIIDNKFVGINLSADYCAEHEWGIEKIRRIWPTDNSKVGIDRYILPKFEAENWLFTDNSIVFQESWSMKYWKEHQAKSNLYSAWDGGGFYIYTEGLHKKEFGILKTHITKCDIALWLGGQRVFENSGLIIAIPSLIPPKFLEEMVKSHKSQAKKDSAALEIEKKLQLSTRLKDKGLKFFALSPYLKEKQDNTKYPIIYWLNPNEYQQYSQKDLYFGYITVEKLLEFLDGNDSVLVKGNF